MEDSLTKAKTRLPLMLLALLGAIWALNALWPGDIPFINDEPQFIYKALRANQHGELARSGLCGSRGFPYGPLPVWMYQAMLGVSHELRIVVVLHALLIGGLVMLALLWLARTLELDPWFMPLITLAPYTWFYTRALWDSLNLPLSALAVASYASFLKRSRWQTLLLTLICMALMPIVHLMTAALLLPLAAHMLIFRWRDLLARFPMLMGVAIGAAITWMPYLSALSDPTDRGPITPSFGPNGWWFPLLGARLISAAHISYMFSPEWMGANQVARVLLYAAVAISILSYPLMWIGLARCAVVAWRAHRSLWRLNARQHMMLIALGTIITQAILDGVTHTHGHPHYYGGTWIIFPLLAWLGFDLLMQCAANVTRAALSAQTIAVAGITIFLAVQIHVAGGMRTRYYGPCLSEEIRAVREINALHVHGPFQMRDPKGDLWVDDPHNFGQGIALAVIHSNVRSFLMYPFSLNVIQELIDPGPAAAPRDVWPAILIPDDPSTSIELKIGPLDHPPKRSQEDVDAHRKPLDQ